MDFIEVGLSHRTADITLLEQMALGGKRREQALDALRGLPGVEGVVVLSTCNRMEIYAHVIDAAKTGEAIVETVVSLCEVPRGLVQPCLSRLTGRAAVEHLFSVASSLDSLVLGEQQIMGQLREAFKTSSDRGCMDSALNHLFRQALETGKRARCETDIADNHVSVATCAVDAAKKAFGSLEGKQVLILGSGHMAELVARYLVEQRATSLIVSSRTYEHATQLACQLGGRACRFEDLPRLLEDSDIVVSSTAAPHRVIMPDLLSEIDHPVFLLDIALPRDIDPRCKELEQVTLYDLEDLRAIAQENRALRSSAAQEARRIVQQEVTAFTSWDASCASLPTIKEIRARAEQVRVHEVQHLITAIQADLSTGDRKAIEKATNAIVNKLLHEPIVRMKQPEGTGASYVEAARFLFGLSDDEPVVSPAPERSLAVPRQLTN